MSKEEFREWCGANGEVPTPKFTYDENNRVNGIVKRVDTSLLPVYETLKTVRSEVLPRIVDVQPLRDYLLIVEEYVHGVTLRYLLDEEGAKDDAFVLRAAKDLLEALNIIHSQTPPIIHRDIKPDNIILREDGRFVLIDFDAARDFSPSSSADTVNLGTHGYASPEQYGFAQSDSRSDIYSLGVLLYELRMGKRFTQSAVCEGKLAVFVGKCTQFEPKNRFQSAGQAAAALEQPESKKNSTKWRIFVCGAAALFAVTLLILNPFSRQNNEANVPAVTSAPIASSTPIAEVNALPVAAESIEQDCTCTLITRGDDPRLEGISIFKYPGTLWIPSSGDVSGELPITTKIGVVVPRDDSHCLAKEHAKQNWTYYLHEQSEPFDGATIDGEYITVTKPGSYIVHYRGMYNGMGYEAGFGFIASDSALAPPRQLDRVQAEADGFIINEQDVLTKYIGTATEVIVPVGVIKIFDDAFRNTIVKSVVIPEGVTSIGSQAFSNCTSLTNVSIPKSMTSIGYLAFWRVPWLSNQKDDFVIVGDGILLSYNGKSNQVVIPDTVKYIGSTALNGRESITSVTIPDSVKGIGDRAFEGCLSLSHITIPGSVSIVGDMAFNNCRSIKTVVVEEGVLEIKNRAFAGCGVLESAVIPDSVVRMELQVFEKSPKVTIYASKDSHGYFYAQDYKLRVDTSK